MSGPPLRLEIAICGLAWSGRYWSVSISCTPHTEQAVTDSGGRLHTTHSGPATPHLLSDWFPDDAVALHFCD